MAEVNFAIDLARILHRQKQNDSPEFVIISMDRDQDTSIGGLQKHCIKHFEDNGVSNDEFDAACNSLFIVSPSQVNQNETFARTVADFSAREPFLAPKTPPGLPIGLPNYASNAYDAVQVLAEGLTRAYKKSPDGHVNGTTVMSEILGLKYTSIFGFDLQIDENGDADGNFNLLTFKKGVGMRPTGSFFSQECSESPSLCTPFIPKLQFLSGQSIEWPRHEIPPDEPECGFNSEYCEELFNWKQIILVTCCFSLTSIALGFIVK